MREGGGLAAKAIGVVAINAFVTVCLLFYSYQQGMGQRLGTPLLIVSTILNMSIMAATLVMVNKNKRAQ